MKNRDASIQRNTRETQIALTVRLDDADPVDIDTGLGFLDHMVETVACHGQMGIRLKAKGDIHVDPHHLVEDVGICLGQALREALGNFSGIERAGFFLFPMDRTLAQVTLDLCGRPNLVWNVPLSGKVLGGVDCHLFADFFKGLTDNLGATIHVNVAQSDGDHHAVEAVFKAFARALRRAITPRDGTGAWSTKGKLDG